MRALIFPGQGAQKPGMGQDILEEGLKGSEFLKQADDAVQFDLLHVMTEDEDRLHLTQYTQPSLVAHSLAILSELQIDFDYTLGHSLGEYAALAASGVLAPLDAVKIVEKRGQLMSQAFPEGVGSMAAVLGMDESGVTKLCAELSTADKVIEPANLNCPGQIVVSGHRELIEELAENAKSYGAKRVIPLNVSGPFHSSLMKVIEQDFAEYLSTFEFHNAGVPVVSNTTARPETDSEHIRQELIKQLYSSVQFEASIRYLIEQGVTEFVEVGPGRVLAGLIKKINRDVTVTSIETVESIKGWNER